MVFKKQNVTRTGGETGDLEDELVEDLASANAVVSSIEDLITQYFEDNSDSLELLGAKGISKAVKVYIDKVKKLTSFLIFFNSKKTLYFFRVVKMLFPIL
jgi:hypothetical protein